MREEIGSTDDGSRKEEAAASGDEARPLTGEPAAAMRLRAAPPRVTRLSRKVLAGIGLVAGVGIGGALIYGLQGRDDGKAPEELVTLGNRNAPDGLNALPKDYGGVRSSGRRCRAISATRSSTRRTAARR
ncbi:Conjugative transfer protein TrbI [Candidatus Paraburkholderia calva]|nr:Conjugative transfer protein TrbI [Candidatus Paraburkholderia calva]